MTTQLDSSIGLKKETTYGTGVTPDHFPEFLSESLEAKLDIKQGQGFRVGSRVGRVERRVLGKQWAEGDIEIEMAARGCGIFLEALLGASVSTALTAPAYQQNFTLATSDPLNSYTIQKGIPLLGGGAAQAHTFWGAVCTKGELSSSQGDVVKLKTSWNAKQVDTATAYAAPSYVASNEVFFFSEGAITIGGTPTAPTATALASGGTSVGDVVDFSLSIDSKLDTNGFTYGGGGRQSRRPVVGGMADIKGKMTVEFDSTTMRDAYLNQTSLAVVLTFTSATSIATGIFNTLQVYIPAIRTNGDLPNATNGVVKQSIDFDVLDNGSGASPVTVCLRTLDTAV
ncbi:phage tail tube protein [Sinomonas sp. JGH33]|uniref:Phage tail tube protein n=1 Tax=Sinomonas terricola TaxID=3110330 RepID=A0ABU5T0W6_9MICC|nr:phage tail tube protein [Sinomonas sp. JGH33]MEA5453302.1 phage tail tube protein [Sinomonas sp. JGH33]